MEMYEIGLPAYHEDPHKFQKERKQKTIQKVADEVERSTQIHGDFHSLHEGYAVFLEEQDELWEEIKRNPIHAAALHKEATHTAAMAFKLLQFIEEKYPYETLPSGRLGA